MTYYRQYFLFLRQCFVAHLLSSANIALIINLIKKCGEDEQTLQYGFDFFSNLRRMNKGSTKKLF